MDVAGIEPGMDFVEAIDRAVGSCEVLIVVIGKQWLTCLEPDGKRRLDNPNDFIRLEAATALRRNVRVIPVLVQGARMPKTDELPGELASLARRQAVEVSDTRWDSDVDQLIKSLESALHPETQPKAAQQPAHLISEKRAQRKIVPTLAVLAAGILLAVIGGLFWPVKVTVPAVSETPLELAKGMITQQGLRTGEIREQETERATPGVVLSQEPSAGSRVEKNTTVNLIVAIAAKITVPNVVGKSADQAKTLLKQAGLEVGTSVPQESSDKAPGLVLAQEPAAASRVSKTTKIDLVLAAAQTTTVPRIVGTNSTDADTALREAGLVLGTRTNKVSDEASGIIMSQHPSPGQVVSRGTKVDVVVAAPVAIAVPNLVNLPFPEARDALGRAKLNIGAVRETSDSSGAAGTVLSQDPSAGRKVSPGTRIDLVVVAKSQLPAEVVVPDLRSLPIDAARNKLKEAQLVPGKTIYRTIEGYKPGTIFGLRPAYPTKVKPGTPIDLYAVAVPPVYATGYSEISPGRTVDLDLLRTDAPAVEADIRFAATSTLVRYLEPLNGAVLAVGGKRSAGRDGCAGASFSSNMRVMINQATIGSFICARTNRGRLAELVPYELAGNAALTLRIRYVTWQ